MKNGKLKTASFNPILNTPFDEPKYYYDTTIEGNLDYEKIINGRRPFVPDIPPIPIPSQNKNLFSIRDIKESYEFHLINRIREEIKQWRSEGYPNITRITKELLLYWFENAERFNRLFFAQREAIETTIWLNEVASRSNAGTDILARIMDAQQQGIGKDFSLPRIAFKMATGSGKTVVMALQILYHYFNRLEYKSDTRFADYFLIVTPGITIKERLNVLYVDTQTNSKNEIKDYYHVRELVPRSLSEFLPNLNSKIIITNYHSFEPKILQGNKRSPFDGKAGTPKNENKESYNLVLKRLLSKFRKDSRLLVINDEAHHCYFPKQNGKNSEENVEEENRRAAVWYTGILEITKKYKLQAVYDLSATPYFLFGSGYQAYTLFPWVVSDFGLIEAIESGLVKIPFLPDTDTTQDLDMPKLRNLYEHVKDELPKKGKRKAKKDQDEVQGHPKIPTLIKNALDQFYSHYERDYEKYRGLFQNPPVFIVVCNNTSVSSELFKYIAGYEVSDNSGNKVNINGKFRLFDNFTQDTKQPLSKPPTLLIDSDALENSEQVNDTFKKVFGPELAKFKADFRITHPGKSVENITDAEILREVVNTVGKKNKLGAHIRCVVSVSMLTEGWDANTVTHIMGLRAFGSQLLCEQVAGRALRRVDYDNFDNEGKYLPEYAQIIGVPFKFFKGGEMQQSDPKETKHIYALPLRQKDFEITFPNIVGYRIETIDDEIRYDFTGIENFELDGSKYPVFTNMANAFSPEREVLTLEQIKEKRAQEVIYFVTKNLISQYFSDNNNNPKFYKFNELKEVVNYWFKNKIHLIGDAFINMVLYEDPEKICHSIMRGIYAAQRKTDKIFPVFNYYNKFGSTKYVYGNTVKEVYPTIKSHVNYVVADTESWEQICAKTLEELDEVISYVKNAYLGFTIPYTHPEKDKPMYYPDFIARCKTKKGKIINLIIEITKHLKKTCLTRISFFMTI